MLLSVLLLFILIVTIMTSTKDISCSWKLRYLLLFLRFNIRPKLFFFQIEFICKYKINDFLICCLYRFSLINFFTYHLCNGLSSIDIIIDIHNILKKIINWQLIKLGNEVKYFFINESTSSFAKYLQKLQIKWVKLVVNNEARKLKKTSKAHHPLILKDLIL